MRRQRPARRAASVTLIEGKGLGFIGLGVDRCRLEALRNPVLGGFSGGRAHFHPERIHNVFEALVGFFRNGEDCQFSGFRFLTHIVSR